MPVVLVTDADQELAEIFATYLVRKGVHVIQCASGGIECLEKLRRFRPDVLVLDRELPWGGGDGVLACLREEYASVAPAVVLTSVDHCPPEQLDAPVFSCLRKPFMLSDLLENVVMSQSPVGVVQSPIRAPGHLRSGSYSRTNILKSPHP